MDIAKIDPNLAVNTIKKTDLVWHPALDKPFSVHGVFFDKELGQYIRMPASVAESVSPSVAVLSRMTTGGRVRFITDSPYLALFCRAPKMDAMPHMPLSGSHGFSVYCNGKYAGKVTPSVSEVVSPHEEGILFGGSVDFTSVGFSEIEIYMPLYAGVCDLNIGVKEGSTVLPAREYKYKKPIVLYGSSITQGACVSRPGNDYAMRLSRLFDAEVLNLGFSGSGNAEPEMLNYLKGIDATAFIFDYNYYSCRPERILPPHFEVYKTLRDANPNAAILMIDKPAYMFEGDDYFKRSEMIRSTYERAVSLGDELVDMMDAKELFGEEEADACLVDVSHPNDLGFYRMASAVYEKLKKLLEKQAQN